MGQQVMLVCVLGLLLGARSDHHLARPCLGKG